VTDPAVVEDEAGRMAIGTYLKIPPGSASLNYTWTSPYAASTDATGGTYELTIQAQPVCSQSRWISRSGCRVVPITAASRG